MPQIIPILLTALPAISSGLGIGTTIAGLVGGGGGTPPIVPTSATGPQSTGTNRAQQASIEGTLPTLQSLTGGSVSPEYAAQFGATQTGLNNNPQAAGNIQAALNQFFGLAAPGDTGLAPGGGGTSITDLLARGGLGAGGRTASSGASGGPGIIDSLLSSDAFKGLAYA